MLSRPHFPSQETNWPRRGIEGFQTLPLVWDGTDRAMVRSCTSVMQKRDDYEDALREMGDISVVVTGRGRLQARLTQVALQHIRLVVVQENLSRIACIRVPHNTMLVAILIDGDTSPTWAGTSVGTDELVTVRGGEFLHTRTDGASHWCAIWLPVAQFELFNSALTGKTPDLPGAVSIWRPPQVPRDRLLKLITAAVRAAHRQWIALTMDEAAHGLEQQLIHSLLECLVEPPVMVEPPAANRRRRLVVRFELLLQSWREANRRISEFSRALGVSARTLQRSCQYNLGMSPKTYLRLHRIHQAHRAIQNGPPQTLRVSDLVKRYGFRTAGEFARSYRETFGELPSWSLRSGGPRRSRAHPTRSRFTKRDKGLTV